MKSNVTKQQHFAKKYNYNTIYCMFLERLKKSNYVVK